MKGRILEKIEMARRKTPTETPEWVNELPARRQRYWAELLEERVNKGVNKPWGYLEEEVTTAELYGAVIGYYGSLEKASGWTENTREELVEFYQSWQDPETGRFHTPNQLDRSCNEKYVIAILEMLDAKPLYPWTTTSATGKIDVRIFVEQTLDHPDWEQGGWGVGSGTGYMALEIFQAINDGQPEFIPDLEQGIANILSYQDPAAGLWGPPSAPLGMRIGGTLKVIGRFGFYLGMRIPYMKELADSLIAHQNHGDWKIGAQQFDECVLRNAVEMVAFCLEASDYRRDTLHATMQGMVIDMRMFDTTDRRRGTIEYACGIAADYLNWQGCVLDNPTRNFDRGPSCKYKLDLQPDGKSVRVVAQNFQ